MALNKSISKSLFLNVIRCNRFFALHKLEHEGENADVAFSTTKSVEDLFSEEQQNKIKYIAEKLCEDSSGNESDEDFDETIATDDTPPIFCQMYTDIEKIAVKKANELLPNSVIKAGKNLSEQYYGSCEYKDFIFYAFIDIYQETDDEIRIYEVKASTNSKQKKKDAFRLENDGIYHFDTNYKAKAVYNRLGSDGIGRRAYDLAYQRYVLEHSKSFNPKHKKVKYYIACLNADYVYKTTSKFFHYPQDYPTDAIVVTDFTYITEKICKEQLESDFDKVVKRINDSHIDTCKLSKECQKGRSRECKYFKQCLRDKQIPEYNPYFYIKSHQAFAEPDNKDFSFFDLFDDENNKHAERISDDLIKKPINLTQKNCLVNKTQYIDKEGIRAWIEDLKYPIYHLDFESAPFPLPRFNGEKCYTQSLFQFSVHIEREPGVCDEVKDNVSYLAPNHVTDTRYELAKKLVDTIKEDGGSILTYNKSFENNRLEELASLFPEFNDIFMNWINNRVVDLMECINPTIDKRNKLSNNYNFNNKYPKQSHFYFYDYRMKSSFSIKKVLPIFSTRTYKDLNVQNGNMAYSTFIKLVNQGKMDYDKLYNDMLTYCRLDTYSMFLILKELRKF